MSCIAFIFFHLSFSGFRKGNVRLSIKTGSWFHGSNITLAEALKVIYYWSVSLTQTQLRRELPLGEQTTVDIYCFLREICATVMVTNASPLGGLDKEGNPITVKIDESKFGKIKYNRVRVKRSACCIIFYSQLTFLVTNLMTCLQISGLSKGRKLGLRYFRTRKYQMLPFYRGTPRCKDAHSFDQKICAAR